MLSEHEYEEIWQAAEARPLSAVWSYSEPEDGQHPVTFHQRREIFFWLLEHLLKEGRIKLAKHGQLLKGSIDEQLDCFSRVFPKTEAEMEDGIWFFDEVCPGGAVWVLKDGSQEWT